MKHLGDITKIHGDKIEPVDCITFGSPCQDLSIAGRRAGLAGERSGLFMEAVRIIKEMRSSTNGLYPTFAVWENVPGAFSSNGGEDFRAVLEELARVEEPDASIPRPTSRGGRWSKAGAIAGNGWSLAWRQLDAQHWGVPQRRKRIALVVDFGGQRAAEILFERTSLSGNSDEGIQTWKTFTRNPERSPFGCDRADKKIIVYDARGNGDGRTCPTITGDHENRINDYTAIVIERQTFNEQSFSSYKESDKCSTLKAKAGNIGNGSECLIVEKTCAGFSYKVGAKANGIGYKTERAPTLAANRIDAAVAERSAQGWSVRRLTPVECERLQGFPSGWTDIGDWTDSKGKKHKYADSPRYKALGNSIALPQWFWLVQKMRPYMKEKPTLGSQFDGLGGFPLVWQRAYGDGTARWASEIEKFPMAVTKRRFGEE